MWLHLRLVATKRACILGVGLIKLHEVETILRRVRFIASHAWDITYFLVSPSSLGKIQMLISTTPPKSAMVKTIWHCFKELLIYVYRTTQMLDLLSNF